ncbi:MAG: molybdopterin cofactor-binding domain-containing protein, partial [Acidimicrobiales bacterium]
MDAQGSILGNAVLRREDPTLLRGEEKYYDDLTVPGVAHVAFVRSTMAHATLGPIDTAEACSMPGVSAVLTADDVELAPFLSFPLLPPVFARPPLATGKVRFVGDIIAAVVADSAGAAADAAGTVYADYEPLGVVVDAEAALADDAPVLFEEHGSNVCFETAIGADDGDPVEGATHVVELTMRSQRLAGVPIEPNGALAVPDGDRLTLWVPSQNPNGVRDALAPLIGMEPDDLRVVARRALPPRHGLAHRRGEGGTQRHALRPAQPRVLQELRRRGALRHVTAQRPQDEVLRQGRHRTDT